MKATDLQDILIENEQLFTKTIFEARHRTAEEIKRFGEPRHYWRAELAPRTAYDTANGQWSIDGKPVDDRFIRNEIVKSLMASRRNFDGADIALSLDVVKALDEPTYREATKAEMQQHQPSPAVTSANHTVVIGWREKAAR